MFVRSSKGFIKKESFHMFFMAPQKNKIYITYLFFIVDFHLSYHD